MNLRSVKEPPGQHTASPSAQRARDVPGSGADVPEDDDERSAAGPAPRARWRAFGWWRRSIRARVIIITFVLSAAVIAVLGIVLNHQVGAGLLRDKQRAALSEFDDALRDAQLQISQADRTDPDSFDSLLEQITTRLAARGGSAEYEVAVLPGTGNGIGYASPPDVRPEEIPTRLRAQVTAGNQADAYTRIERARPLRARLRGRRPAVDPQRAVPALLPVPALGGGGDAQPGPRHARSRWRRAARPAHRHRRGRDATCGHTGAGGGAGLGAAGGRSSATTHAGARRGRLRPARDLVQRDGRGAATPDPAAGGAFPRAAPLHRRRLPRVAHAADDRPDGR